MKPSRYNHFFELRDRDIVLAYNAYSGALAEIERDHLLRVRQLMEDQSLASTPQDQEFLQCLKDGGFLIPDAVDQAGALRATAKKLRLEGSILTLTIAPTLACNFGCDYCYEARSNIRMSTETQDALLAFSDRYLNRAEALRVCWFGGEPTICMSILDRVQAGLLEIADRHGTEVVPGAIVTNGYLLDAAMALHLKELGITQAQITIDGPEEVHDRRRKLANGKGTFRRIIDNLVETCEILEISIRINVDKGNVDSAGEVVELLQERGILPKVRVHFGQVTSSGTACADIRDRCFSDPEFSQTQVQIYEKLHEKGIYQFDYPKLLAAGAFCGALSEGYFVVAPDGNLFRCWEDLSLDSAKAVGSVHLSRPRDDRQRRNIEAYKSWDPFAMAECRDCNILPICMGGCPVFGMKDDGSSRGVCVPWKYNLNQMVTLRYRSETHGETGPT